MTEKQSTKKRGGRLSSLLWVIIAILKHFWTNFRAKKPKKPQEVKQETAKNEENLEETVKNDKSELENDSKSVPKTPKNAKKTKTALEKAAQNSHKITEYFPVRRSARQTGNEIKVCPI